MKPLEIMMKSMEMLEIPIQNKNGRRNLGYRLPEIVEHLLLESLGDGEPKDSWVEESVRLLRPDCYNGSPLSRENMAPVYANLVKVYDFINLNGLIETKSMKKFRLYLVDLQKITGHLVAKEVCKN